jgi:uncharacterized protein with PQ loop repeat
MLYVQASKSIKTQQGGLVKLTPAEYLEFGAFLVVLFGILLELAYLFAG